MQLSRSRSGSGDGEEGIGEVGVKMEPILADINVDNAGDGNV